MRIKFIPLEKSKDNSTEILRNKIVEGIAKSIELNEYIDPVTGERFTTSGAAARYARMFGDRSVSSIVDYGPHGKSQSTRPGAGGNVGWINTAPITDPGDRRAATGKITSIRTRGGGLPVPVIDDRVLAAVRAARRRRGGGGRRG